MITTRYGLNKDIERFIVLAEEGVKEIAFADEVDVDVLRNSLVTFMNNPMFFFRVAVNEQDMAVGALAALVTQTWFSSNLCTEGVGLFVDPAYRGLSISKRLYRDYIAWGKKFDSVKVIRTSTSAGPHLDMTRMLTGIGFEKVGGVYAMRGN